MRIILLSNFMFMSDSHLSRPTTYPDRNPPSSHTSPILTCLSLPDLSSRSPTSSSSISFHIVSQSVPKVSSIAAPPRPSTAFLLLGSGSPYLPAHQPTDCELSSDRLVRDAQKDFGIRRGREDPSCGWWVGLKGDGMGVSRT